MMRQFNKKGSMIIVYMILGLALIVLAIPIVKYIKDSSDSQFFKDNKINPADDFVPYNPRNYLTVNDQKVQNSIDALNCAVNSVADVSNEYDDDSCMLGTALTNSSCIGNDYAFGNTCVSCDSPIYKLESKKDSNGGYSDQLSEVANLAIKCDKDFKSKILKQKLDTTKILFININKYICSVIDTSKFEGKITQSELKSQISKELNNNQKAQINSLSFKMSSDLSNLTQYYCNVYVDNALFDDIELVPCSEVGYDKPSEYSCTITAFELPQGNQNSSQWYTEWLIEQKAPGYLLYYEAFTQAEEINWASDYGRVTSGAYVQAAGFGLVFGALSSGTKAIKGTYTAITKTFPSGIKKTIKSFPSRLLSSANRKATKATMDEIARESFEYGVIPAARKQYVRDSMNSIDYQAIKQKLSASEIKDLENAALSQNKDKVKQILNQIDPTFNRFGADNAKLNDLALGASLVDEKGIANCLTFRKYISSFTDSASLIKAYKNTIKTIDGIPAETKKLILDDISKNALFADKKIVNDMLSKTKIADRIPDTVDPYLNDLSKNLFTDVFNLEKGGIRESISNPETRNFLQSLYDIAKNKIPDGMADADKKYLLNKYITGEIIYMMQSQASGIVDRYESRGVNSINLGQPYAFGPKPVVVNENINSVLDNHILMLSRAKSISDGTPRFYLASPCKTDLEIKSTYCSCDVEKGAPVYLSPNGVNFKIENLALNNPNYDMENSRVFWYDSLSPANQDVAIKACVYAKNCAQESLNDPNLQEAYRKLFIDGLFLNSLDWIGSLNQDTCYSEIQSDTPLYDFWTGYYDTKIPSNKGKPILGFKTLFKTLFPTKQDAKNSDLYLLMEAIAVTTTNGKNCMIKSKNGVSDDSKTKLNIALSDTLFSKFTNIEGESITSEQAILATQQYVDFLYTISKSVYDSTISTPSEYIKFKIYLDKIARYYYFNYYLLQSQVDTTKIAKSCTNMVQSTKKASDELSDLKNNYYDPANQFVNMKSQCMLIKPYNYSTYTNNGYPYNYCFTGDSSAAWKVAREINNYGWSAVDIGTTALVGTFSLGWGAPFAYAASAAATSVAQTGLDGYIMSQEKWPQTKKTE